MILKEKLRGVCWQFTSHCNMGCSICLGYKGEIAASYENRKRIVDQLKLFGFKSITFTGGEPLLDSDLFNIIKYAKEKEFYLGICTNGLLLSPRLCTELDSYIDEIALPLDGSNSLIHAYHRHSEDHFYRIIRLTDLLKTKRFHTDISTVLTNYNKNDMHDILSLLLKTGVKRWKINRFYSIGQGALNKQKYDLLDKDFASVRSRLLMEPAILSGQIEVLIKDNNESVMKSYVNISPAGNIFLMHQNNYIKIKHIVDVEDIHKLLRENDFQFEIHSKRHFKGQ